ncbi:hypothetical protein [Geoalkalibacter halelectricus]|uniref:hypothetical protein n=1 Tax=Geoalkalibacter halelectricus TaxID=2847045 RepID=UPI00266F1F5A|nr:hypothetical protein [Geoalkalibacter halelectricus]MDO3377680.1 hypothetical protein [Geoalkalibacter halelectricus]
MSVSSGSSVHPPPNKSRGEARHPSPKARHWVARWLALLTVCCFLGLYSLAAVPHDHGEHQACADPPCSGGPVSQDPASACPQCHVAGHLPVAVLPAIALAAPIVLPSAVLAAPGRVAHATLASYLLPRLRAPPVCLA